VCGDQVGLYNELLDEFAKYDARMLGVSVDGSWCHAAFAHDRTAPLGSKSANSGKRSHLSPMGINPGADGILDALEQLPRKSGSPA
jgi:hypothetical protein